MIDYILFGCCIFILAGSIALTIKTRFVQLRLIPQLFRMLKASRRQKNNDQHTISPLKALFTAMSTTLGISSIVGPVMAIKLGGPGALLGFLLSSFFGSAATFVEVNLSIQYREKLPSGGYMGGPMQYLKHIISPKAAKFYALCGLVLMTVWSAAQANQLAAILDSPLLGDYRISTLSSALLITALICVSLMGGIKRIGALSAKIVPAMFTLYVGSCLWILGSNLDQLGSILQLIFRSVFTPYELATGAVVGGIVSAIRWGIFKGTQATEAGVGTQAIPHSMAETKDASSQGTLAMLSTYTAGAVAFLSGCVALITNTWQDPSLPLGMSMVAASFNQYFSYIGVAIVSISAFLFGFGTILGNSFNGSQCYAFLTNNKHKKYYLIMTLIMILVGAASDAQFIWSHIDIFLACMIVPHMTALLLHAFRKPQPLATSE
jgi:alanine or glycine:cation symporter, AGCS family